MLYHRLWFCTNITTALGKRLYPSRHETLNQCWFNVGPPSWRWSNIKPALVQRLVLTVSTLPGEYGVRSRSLELTVTGDVWASLPESWYDEVLVSPSSESESESSSSCPSKLLKLWLQTHSKALYTCTQFFTNPCHSWLEYIWILKLAC